MKLKASKQQQTDQRVDANVINVGINLRDVGQQEGAAAVDRMIAYGQCEIVDICGTSCDG